MIGKVNFRMTGIENCGRRMLVPDRNVKEAKFIRAGLLFLLLCNWCKQ
jgi:hypothetical protein